MLSVAEPFDLVNTKPPDPLETLHDRAVAAGNAALADLTGRLLANAREGYPPALQAPAAALLVSSYLSASQGLSLAAWVRSTGGWTPHHEALAGRGLLPPAWEHQPVDVPAAPGTDPLPTLPADAIVPRKHLAELLHVTERTITRWVSEGRLPPPAGRFGRQPAWSGAALRQHFHVKQDREEEVKA